MNRHSSIRMVALSMLAAVSVRATVPLSAGASTAIKANELGDHVEWLADDKREGRGPGTRGLEESARYIENAFKRWKLPPAGDGGGYRQSFDAPAGMPLVHGGELLLGREALRFGVDFLPIAASDSGRITGDLVAVPPGEVYGDMLRGRIAVVLPATSSPRVPAPTVSAAWDARLRELEDAGASGAIALVDTLPVAGSPGAEFAMAPSGVRRGGAAAGAAGGANERAFVAAFVTRAAWARALGAQATEHVPENTAAILRIDLTRETISLANIVVRIPGTDTTLANAPVVIGAHYDHLGISADGKTVMNGADDNASGVAVLLEIAEALRAAPRRARPVYLAAFSGEERGLLGSTHFVETLPAVSGACIAMLNLDTVGRPQEGRMLVLGTGTSPDWPLILAGIPSGEDIALVTPDPGFDIVPVDESYASSDHWPFARRGVPAVQFFGGPHADYHRSTDDADRVDLAALERVARYVMALAEALTDRHEPLTPAPRVAPAAGEAREASREAGDRPWLGSVPDFAHAGSGVKLSGVSAGSPAEKAGLRSGDVITELAGQPIDTLADLAGALRAHRVGDEIEVVFQRNGMSERVQLVLAKRP